jgi:DNA gyrase/topoisomerase IV subunit B
MQGAFPLRGKFINVTELPNTKIVQNQEVRDLLTAIGLRMGEIPNDLRYGKILIYSDADPDGDSIAGLLINFFGRFWPEMFDQERICRVMTPLVVACKGKDRLLFYTSKDFITWTTERTDLTKWNIEYKKGLASLEDSEYREIIQNPKFFILKNDGTLKESLDIWFGDDVTLRKKKIHGE